MGGGHSFFFISVLVKHWHWGVGFPSCPDFLPGHSLRISPGGGFLPCLGLWPLHFQWSNFSARSWSCSARVRHHDRLGASSCFLCSFYVVFLLCVLYVCFWPPTFVSILISVCSPGLSWRWSVGTPFSPMVSPIALSGAK